MAAIMFTDANRFDPGYILSDIRNGLLDDIVEVLPRGAIPRPYFWVSIREMPNEAYVPNIQTLARLTFSYMRAVAPDLPIPEARDKAIVLSCIRAGARTSYALGAADMSTDELAPTLGEYIQPAPAIAALGAPGDPGHIAAVPATFGGINLVWGGGTADAGGTAWGTWVDFTPEEMEVAKYHIMLGIPILVTQGWSIVKCGHHFFSNPAQGMRGGWDALKRHWTSKSPPQVTAWVNARAGWWEDICFHKALHPIRMQLKVALAQDPVVVEKVKASGWGSAAVRLPATEPDFEFVKVTLALAQKTKMTLLSMGGSIDVSRLEAAFAEVLAAGTAGVRMRLIAESVALAKSNIPAIAYMVGNLTATLEAAGMGTSSLLNSFGVKRVKEDNPAMVATGAAEYRAYRTRRQAEMERGEAAAPRIVF